MMGTFGMGSGMLLWAVLVVAFLAVAVVVVARVLRRPADVPARAVDRRDDWMAEDEIRMRYARGELDSEEFRRRMEDLRDN